MAGKSCRRGAGGVTRSSHHRMGRAGRATSSQGAAKARGPRLSTARGPHPDQPSAQRQCRCPPQSGGGSRWCRHALSRCAGEGGCAQRGRERAARVWGGGSWTSHPPRILQGCARPHPDQPSAQRQCRCSPQAGEGAGGVDIPSPAVRERVAARSADGRGPRGLAAEGHGHSTPRTYCKAARAPTPTSLRRSGSAAAPPRAGEGAGGVEMPSPAVRERVAARSADGRGPRGLRAEGHGHPTPPHPAPRPHARASIWCSASSAVSGGWSVRWVAKVQPADCASAASAARWRARRSA